MISRPLVSVVGAGIVGAAVAFALARSGMRVRVVERRERPGEGVTRHSFGWINNIHGQPEDRDAYAMRLRAIDHFHALNAELAGRLFCRPTGSLVWTQRPDDTEALALAHRAAGARISLVDRRRFSELEPHFAEAPQCAAHSPDDIALDATDTTRILLEAARDHGAELRFGVEVKDFEGICGRLTGIVTPDTIWPTDVAVICTGGEGGSLAARHGLGDRLSLSPVALVRFDAKFRMANGIVCGPDIEVRQDAANQLIATADCPDSDDPVSLSALAQQVRDTLSRLFHRADGIGGGHVGIGWRPMPNDRQPIIGPLHALEGLFAAISHPGVIHAPMLAREIVRLIK